ncbi:MAG: hypothetical protein ACI9FB_001355 [Candidatus Azotimanducaceae bacterium]|jgi:hypothetical protein
MTKLNAVVQSEDDARTIDARQIVRNQLESDVAAFLSKGGSVQEVEANITADPPSKPSAKYGGQPI